MICCRGGGYARRSTAGLLRLCRAGPMCPAVNTRGGVVDGGGVWASPPTFSLMKEKYEHSRVNPSASLRSAPPFTQGRLWCGASFQCVGLFTEGLHNPTCYPLAWGGKMWYTVPRYDERREELTHGQRRY